MTYCGIVVHCAFHRDSCEAFNGDVQCKYFGSEGKGGGGCSWGGIPSSLH